MIFGNCKLPFCVDTLRAELLNKITDIRHEVLKANHTTKPSSVSLQQSQPQQFVPSEPASQQQLNLSSANQPETCPEVNLSPTVITSSETQVIQNTHKVLIAGDSLLHRMNASKMKVCDTPSVRLAKKGDSLAGTVARVKDNISRHQNVKADLVLLAGTNDLSSRSVSPEILISSLENSIAELKEFSNLQQIFICKIPPRFDFHNVNSKVTRYNVLLEEHFPDSDFVHVLDTVTPEFRHYHTDGLHLITYTSSSYNIYIRFGGQLFRQMVGIPMGTNCAPHYWLTCFSIPTKMSFWINS